MVGAALGALEGTILGALEGAALGDPAEAGAGLADGAPAGLSDSTGVGLGVGAPRLPFLGAGDGEGLGLTSGEALSAGAAEPGARGVKRFDPGVGVESAAGVGGGSGAKCSTAKVFLSCLACGDREKSVNSHMAVALARSRDCWVSTLVYKRCRKNTERGSWESRGYFFSQSRIALSVSAAEASVCDAMSWLTS